MGRERRNIGILAHIDAGKTTLTEQLLFLGGATRRPGAVDHGTTVSDWMVDEQERGITITSAAATFRWRNADITLVDTPGHIDFTMEVERTLRVLDGVVVVVSAPDGIQAQTETVWNQIAFHGLPAIFFINKLDLPGVDTDAVVSELQDRLGIVAVPLQTVSQTVRGYEVADLMTDSVHHWHTDGNEWVSEESAGDHESRAALLERLANAAASHDDEYALEVLQECRLSTARHLAALQCAVVKRAAFPVVYGIARRGLGVASLADAVSLLLPSAEGKALVGIDPASGPHAYVFKTEPRRQARLAYVRVYGQRLTAGLPLYPAGRTTPLEPAPCAEVFGGDFSEIATIEGGQIAALVYPREGQAPRTGDTLWLSPRHCSVEPLRPPEPVLQRVIEARDTVAHEKILSVLQELCADDPSLRYAIEATTGRVVLSGMGELHLEIAIDRIRRTLGFEIRTGNPTIIERWRLQSHAEAGARVQHPSGRGYVDVVLSVEPAESFVAQVPGVERDDYRCAFHSGLEQAVGVDGLGGRVLSGCRITVNSLTISGAEVFPTMVRDAAFRATERALEAAGTDQLEPWAYLEVLAPDAAIGRVLGDLARRRARHLGSESRGSSQAIRAEVPIADLLGYATALRSLTGGRAAFSLAPGGFRSKSGRADPAGT